MAKKNGNEEKAKKARKKVRTESQRQPVRLSDLELLDFGQRLARCQQTLAEHVAHAEAVKKDLKTKEAQIESDRSHFAGIIRDKAELRDVEVEVWHDYETGTYEEIRTDTGEVVYQRRLAIDERQGALPLKAGDGVPDVHLMVDGKPYSLEQTRAALDVVKARKTMPREDEQEIAAAHAPGRTPPSQAEI